MQLWQRNLLFLGVGSLITASSFSMVIPFLPLFLIQIGVHKHVELWSGVLYSAAFFAGAISAPYWGSMSDKYGRKPMIVRAGIVLFFVYSLTALANNPYEVLLLRIAQGLLSGYIPGAIALIGTNTPEHKVGYALSMISAASSVGAIIGPLLGGFIAHWTSNRVAFISAGVLVLFSTVLVVFWVKEESFIPSSRLSSIFGTMKDALKNRPLLYALLLNMFTSFSIMTIEPVLTLYIAQLNHSLINASLIAGVVFSISGIAAVIFAPIWGKLADRIGFSKILLIGLIGSTIWTFLQLPFHTVWEFAAVRFMYGVFFSAVFPAINGLVVHATEPSFRGRAFGVNQTANQIGFMLGPIIGGVIAEKSSIHGVFWATGTLLLLVGGLSFFIQQRSRIKNSTSS